MKKTFFIVFVVLFGGFVFGFFAYAQESYEGGTTIEGGGTVQSRSSVQDFEKNTENSSSDSGYIQQYNETDVDFIQRSHTNGDPDRPITKGRIEGTGNAQEEINIKQERGTDDVGLNPQPEPPSMEGDSAGSAPPVLIHVRKVEVRGWDPGKKEEFLAEVKTHAEVQSGQDLERFATGVLLRDENIEELELGNEVKVRYRMPAKFLGIFSASLRTDIDADNEARVKVKYPWYHFLYSKPVPALEMQVRIESELSTVGDDAQLANIDLQNALQRQAQILQTISNVSKMLHDTALSVIRKIG